MRRMKLWALIPAAATLYHLGCGGLGGGSLGNSTLAITAVEVFDIALGALVGSFFTGINLGT